MSDVKLERINSQIFKALVDTIHAYQVAAHRAAGTTSGVTMHGTRFHDEALNEARAKQDALEVMIVAGLTAVEAERDALRREAIIASLTAVTTPPEHTQ